MIARTLSQWLARLFAWWPGRKRRSQAVAAEASGASSAPVLAPQQRPLPGMPTSTSPSTPASGLASQAGPASRLSLSTDCQDLFVPPKLPPPPGALGSLSFLSHGFQGFPGPVADPNSSLSERLPWMGGSDFLLPMEAPASSEEQTGEPGEPSPMTLVQQRRLEFLRYLVKRGFVNEGFDQEDLPEQYRLP